jgi:uncharacterized protein YjbI with pentapeptide repeats
LITIKFENDKTLEIDRSTLRSSVLSGFDFHRAIFDDMDLEFTDFRASELRGASLRNIKAARANFSTVSLMTSDFSRAKLKGAKFLDSKVMYTDFNDADLSDSDITGANVLGAVFKGSDLRGATMLCEGLDSTELDGAIYDLATVWPDGFDPLLKNAILVKD